jgi:hypothetical protein
VQVTVCPTVLHVQPAPEAVPGVSPAGKVSVTVTVVPFVAVAPEFVAVMVYEPLEPRVKLPECVLLMVRSGNWLMVVASLAELLPVLVSPPPVTEAVFVTLAGAVAETLTVKVIAE